MRTDDELVLMDSPRIGRSFKRMGYEIAERNSENQPVLLLGIDQRGFIIAQTLAQVLTPLFSVDVKAARLPVKEGKTDQALREVGSDFVRDQFLIVVDDVIFSGQTMFRALTKISQRLNPKEVHTAVLVDRGHRKFPIQAEFFGMELPTKLNEHVSVVAERGEVQQVILTN